MLSLLISLFRRRPLARRYAVLARPRAELYQWIVIDLTGRRWIVETDRPVAEQIARELNRSRKAVTRG